jgi:predicted phage-related endonuclease
MELKVIAENASVLSYTDPQAFALLRRAGFGASDSSILLGVNPFPDGKIEKLLEQKRSTVLTQSEIDIGNLVNVRKGADLEPIILRKFMEQHNVHKDFIEKPTAMYRIGDTPLTVNFDGVMVVPPHSIPVECKFISTYGAKYYNMGKATNDRYKLYDLSNLGTDVNALYLTRRAEEAGIPIYYYTQIQQQMLALDAPYGYLAALFDKDWELRTFVVMADERVQQKLLEVAEYSWKMI